MKKLNILISLLSMLPFSSCNDYIDILPKGTKIPTTLADFEPLICNEEINHLMSVADGLELMNDVFVGSSSLNSPTLTQANYLWDESADRVKLNDDDDPTFIRAYGSISTCNLLLEHLPEATDCTQEEKNELTGYARTLRAFNYLCLVNYYADTYSQSTAAETRGVPFIQSANVDAPHSQISVAEMYDFIIKELNEAISTGDLPDMGTTELHPGKGAAYAMLARAYLMMGRYTDALTASDKALAINDRLYDWVKFYNKNMAKITDPENYQPLSSPMGYGFCETYYFRHTCGVNVNITYFNPIPVSRAKRFEDGDTKFLSTWKLRTSNTNESYYYSPLYGFFNTGGITTTEMYLIKAECLARSGKIDKAMEELNKVREKRILPEKYTPAVASDLSDAIEKIRITKENDLIMSIVPFMDWRRFNAEGTYARTMEKEYNGRTLTLKPDSHLWTMVFSQGTTGDSGNGKIIQNSK